MRVLPRREFLHDTAAVAAALAAVPAMRASAALDDDGDVKPAGPNDTVRVAVCGVNGRGKDHINGWNHQKDVRITAICDVDLGSPIVRARWSSAAPEAAPKVVQDIRRAAR